MKVSYTLAVSDLVSFAVRLAARGADEVGALHRVRTGLSWLLWLLMCLYIWASSDLPFAYVPALLVGCMIVLAIIEGRARRLRAASLYSSPDNASLIGPRVLTLAAEGLSVSTGSTEFRVRWAAIREAERSPTHLYLYLSGIHALLIPVRGLSAEEAAALETALRTNLPDLSIQTVA